MEGQASGAGAIFYKQVYAENFNFLRRTAAADNNYQSILEVIQQS